MSRLRPVHIHLLMAVASIALVAVASSYFQAALNLLPCPLCVIQRIAYLLVAAIAIVAVLHRPRGSGRVAYGTLLLLASVAGAAVAAWQVFLTYQPEVASCGISPEERFLNKLALAKWWPSMFEANGDCTSVTWTLFGLSIPELSLIAFLALAAAAVWAMRRR